MKDSGIKWIGDIPEDWKLGRVKNIFYLSKKKANSENPTVLSLSRDGIKKRNIFNNEGQLAASYKDYNPVLPGDLLLNPMDLYSGANCNMSEIEGVISPAYTNLRTNKDVNAKFYDYYFKFQYWVNAMFMHGKGVSFDNRWTMDSDTILNYYIPMPDLAIQNKITLYINNKLTKVDELISLQEKEIEKLNEYKKSLITKAVTKGLDPNVKMKDSGIEWLGEIPEDWRIIKAKKIGKFSASGIDKTIKKNEIPVKIVNYIDVYKSKDHRIYNDEYMQVTTTHKKINYNLLKKGDMLFTPSSETVEEIGISVLVEEDLDNTAFSYHLLRFKFNDDVFVYHSFKKYLFNNHYIYNAFSSKSTGSIRKTLNRYDFESLNIILPTYNEQKESASFLDKKTEQINSLIKIKQQKMEKLKEYKKSLIYEYVTGKKQVI
ncbi:MAG: restriction endonuclease subunit S [Clostridia bacterium]|nr:restriction endonuclease subunit S [Clostridia bacterium]